MKFTGQVIKEPFAIGSKSERQALFLVTSNERYLLQRKGGNPYHDEELEKLAGKTVEVEGETDDYALVISDWKIVK
jgi:hypothetical protein